MATRVISIDLVGRNLASGAFRGVARDAEVAAAKSAAVFDASTSRIGRSVTAVGRLGSNFSVPFVGALSVIGSKLDETSGKGKQFGSTLSAIGGAELLAAGAAVGFIGVSAVHAADNFDVAHARLQQAVVKTGQSFSSATSGVSSLDDKFVKLGFNTTETENALSILTTATHDVSKAQADMGLTADVARARNKDLADVAVAFTKAAQGNYTSLIRLGVVTKDQTKNFHSMADVVAYLSGIFGGQAAAHADTFAGKLEVVKAQANQLEVSLGSALIPKVEGLASATVAGVQRFEEFNRSTDGAAGKVLALGAAVPVGVFAIEKLGKAGVAIGGQFVKAGSAVGGALGLISDAGAATGTVISGVGTSAEITAVKQAKLIVANKALAGATDVSAAANARLDAAMVAMAAAEEGDVVAAQEVAAAHTKATAALSAQTLAAQRAAAAEAELTIAQASVSGTGAGASLGVGVGAATAGAAASLGVVAGAAAIPLAGLAFGIYTLRQAAAKDAEIKSFTADLLKAGHAADTAEASLSKVIAPDIGNRVGADLRAYGDALLSGADRSKLAAAQAALHGDALQQEAVKFMGAGRAAHASADEIDYYRKNSTAFAEGLREIESNIDVAKGKLESLTKQYGAGAIKSAELSGAQKQLRDDLISVATGADRSGAAHRRLGGDRAAVGKIGAIVAGVEKQVQAATDGTTASLNANAAASSASKDLSKQLSAAQQKYADDLLNAGSSAQTLFADKQNLASAGRHEAAIQAQVNAAMADGASAYLTLAGAASQAAAAQAAAAGAAASQHAFAPIVAQISVDTTHTGFQQALHNLTNPDTGSSGGGGGGGQTATAKELEQSQKALTLRDAQRAVAQSSRDVVSAQQGIVTAAQGVTDAQKALTQAYKDNRTAVAAEETAERNYQIVLHGHAVGSKAAADATRGLADAQRAAKSSALDLLDAQRALTDAQAALKAAPATAAAANASAQRQLTSAQLDAVDAQKALDQAQQSGDPEVVARAEIALADAQQRVRDATNASAAAQKHQRELLKGTSSEAEAVKRAQLALKDAQEKQTDAVKATNEAQRVYNGTLHGFPPTSQEAVQAHQLLTQAQQQAKQATDSLTQAQRALQSAQQQTTTAALALQSAQDQTATSALNLRRAQADLNGQLTSSSGAAKASKQLESYQTRLDAVTSAALAAGDAIRQHGESLGHEFGSNILDEIHALEGFAHANPALAHAFDSALAGLEADWRNHMALLNAQQPFSPSSAGSHIGQIHAAGGPVVGNDPNGIEILAHPGEYVVQAKAVEKYGVKAMEQLNAGKTELLKFAVGGPVREVFIAKGTPGLAGVAGEPGRPGELGRAGAASAVAQGGAAGPPATASAVGAAGRDGSNAALGSSNVNNATDNRSAMTVDNRSSVVNASTSNRIDNRVSTNTGDTAIQKFATGGPVDNRRYSTTSDQRTSSASDNRTTIAGSTSRTDNRAGDSSTFIGVTNDSRSIASTDRSVSSDNRTYASISKFAAGGPVSSTNVAYSTDNRRSSTNDNRLHVAGSLDNRETTTSGGPTGDHETLAIVHPREFVLRESAVEKYGLHTIEKINAGTLPEFASGGPIGMPQVSLPRERVLVGSGGSEVHVHIHGDVYGVDDLDERVRKGLREYRRLNGPGSI